jgi:hypothetical protein
MENPKKEEQTREKKWCSFFKMTRTSLVAHSARLCITLPRWTAMRAREIRRSERARISSHQNHGPREMAVSRFEMSSCRHAMLSASADIRAAACR